MSSRGCCIKQPEYNCRRSVITHVQYEGVPHSIRCAQPQGGNSESYSRDHMCSRSICCISQPQNDCRPSVRYAQPHLSDIRPRAQGHVSGRRCCIMQPEYDCRRSVITHVQYKEVPHSIRRAQPQGGNSESHAQGSAREAGRQTGG